MHSGESLKKVLRARFHKSDCGPDVRLSLPSGYGSKSRRSRWVESYRLPHQHFSNDSRLQTISWTEAVGRSELNGGTFGDIKIHSLRGVKNFAMFDVIYKNLPVVRACLGHQPHPLPLRFVALAVNHVR